MVALEESFIRKVEVRTEFEDIVGLGLRFCIWRCACCTVALPALYFGHGEMRRGQAGITVLVAGGLLAQDCGEVFSCLGALIGYRSKSRGACHEWDELRLVEWG